MKYTKKSITIDAFKFDGDLIGSNGEFYVPDWAKKAFEDGILFYQGEPPVDLTVKTLEGNMKADVGDYIIQGIKGEIYPCKPDIFELSYSVTNTIKDNSDIKFLKEVKEFHNTFGHPVLDKPTIPLDRKALRIGLLMEELKELEEASITHLDIVESADALADLMYVLCGAILEFGLADKFEDIFNEVHRSNMSKACKTMEEVEDTIANYAEQGISTYYKKNNEFDLYIIYRTSDDKILKSINYSPANLKQFL